MGVFNSKDSLDELKKNFLYTDNTKYEYLILEIILNMSKLISPSYKDKQKTRRIENAAKIMYNTIADIIQFIYLDPEDFDDIMLLREQYEYRVKIIHSPKITTSEWIQIWDDTQDKLTELYNIASNLNITSEHQRYYKSILSLAKAVKLMYKKRDLYSPEPNRRVYSTF